MADYIALGIVAALAIGGGLWLLREARRWKARKQER